ncbi:unnamed protein product [Amaranthus hypochondriacus]
MVEPAKARGPGRPRKNEAQKTTVSTSQTGGKTAAEVQPVLGGKIQHISKTPPLKSSTQLKMMEPTTWASIVNGDSSNNGEVSLEAGSKSISEQPPQSSFALVKNSLENSHNSNGIEAGSNLIGSTSTQLHTKLDPISVTSKGESPYSKTL